jgi:hypothetical protein
MITKEYLETVFSKYFNEKSEPKRGITMYTNVAGMDLFDEALEADFGYKRAYIGYRVPRILWKIKGIKIYKSGRGKYYRRVKI